MRAILLPDGLLVVLGCQGQSSMHILHRVADVRHTVARIVLQSGRLQVEEEKQVSS